MEECLHGWTEERLVHEFYSVLEGQNCVDIMHCLLFWLGAGWIMSFCMGGQGCAWRPGREQWQMPQVRRLVVPTIEDDG